MKKLIFIVIIGLIIVGCEVVEDDSGTAVDESGENEVKGRKREIRVDPKTREG